MALLALAGSSRAQSGAARPAAAALWAERRAILEREFATLDQLATDLHDRGSTEAAQRVLLWLTPLPPPDGPLRFRPRSEVETAAELARSVPREVQPRVAASAGALFALAQRAAAREPAPYSLIDACLRDVIRRQPDHAEARRLLGFVPYEGGWATPDAAALLRAGKVLHPDFGWVPKDWVPHLDDGELPGLSIVNDKPAQWLPAAEADELRRDFARRPWRITTPHFEIASNAPFSEVITFGRRLEDFHDLFNAWMAEVIGRDRLPLARRLRDPKLQPQRTPASERHSVWYFGSKADYVATVGPLVQADVSIELGRYQPASKASGKAAVPSRSYFYRDPEGAIESTATLYHEVSHQLLFESAGPTKFERNSGNFWVWEGLGTYFETVQPQADGTLSHGDRISSRFQAAIAQFVDKGPLPPLADFVALNRSQFDAEPGVYAHYQQAMALALFLMQAEGGRYREPFLAYVRAAYSGKVTRRASTLESFLGTPLAELEPKLTEYLRQGRALAPGP